MNKITVLSPHLDDSSFSLGLALTSWSATSLKLRIINFFTQSAYAPYSSATDVEAISAIRKEEDRSAISFISSDIEIVFLDLLDAPLRLELPFNQITQLESSRHISDHELRHLSGCIQENCANSLTIAPLALGSHVDHVAVHHAALDAITPEQLAFYEDLPYATWTSPADVEACIKSIQQKTGMALKPVLVQNPAAIEQKRKIASFYQSQITAKEADSIAQFSQTYGNGERLWLPEKSKYWDAIELLAISTPQTANLHQPR